MEAFEDGPLPVTPTVLTFLLRAGDVEAAARPRGGAPASTSTTTTGSRCSTGAAPPRPRWACGDRELARRGVRRAGAVRRAHGVARAPATPWARSTPFLAQAAAAVGDPALAARHADDALRLMEEWQIPLAAQWLRDQRDRYGF